MCGLLKKGSIQWNEIVKWVLIAITLIVVFLILSQLGPSNLMDNIGTLRSLIR